jgi:hypothetical protein
LTSESRPPSKARDSAANGFSAFEGIGRIEDIPSGSCARSPEPVTGPRAHRVVNTVRETEILVTLA